MYDKVSELHNDSLAYILMNTMNYQKLKEKKMEPKYDLDNLSLNTYNYDAWFEKGKTN